MRKCALIFFAIMIANHCSGMDIIPLEQQHIIVLNGTTTAGKSTIAAKIKERLERQSFFVEVLAIDNFMVPKVQWALGINRLNPFNCFVPNIDIITSSEIETMGKESQIELCLAARAACGQGKIVIIDAPIYRPDQVDFYKKSLAGFKTTWALVYCPLLSLVNGIIGRNQKSGLSDRRSLLQGLYQFSCMYRGNGEIILDSLSQENLRNICDEAQEQHTIEQDHTFDFLKSVQKAICPFSFDDIRQSLSKNLLLNDNVATEICPVVQHDCIVNTAIFDSNVCAQTIIDFVFDKIKND